MGLHIGPDGLQDLTVGHPGAAENAGGQERPHQRVTVGVDQAGDQHFAGQVNDLRAAFIGPGAFIIAHIDDPIVPDRDGGNAGHLTVHGVHAAILKHSCHGG